MNSSDKKKSSRSSPPSPRRMQAPPARGLGSHEQQRMFLGIDVFRRSVA